MNDELVLRHVDKVKRIRLFASPDLLYPEQYVFVVGSSLLGRVYQGGPDVNHDAMYARVLEGIERARAKIRRENRHLPKGFIVGAVIVAWEGKMKGETLRRLAAAEAGAGELARWSMTRNVENSLIDSLWAQAEGPDHMTRVRALLKLADIFGLKPPESAKHEDGGVLYVDPISTEFAPTDEDLEILRSSSLSAPGEPEGGHGPLL